MSDDRRINELGLCPESFDNHCEARTDREEGIRLQVGNSPETRINYQRPSGVSGTICGGRISLYLYPDS